MEKIDVVIVGAGLAGLCCARAAQEAGLECRVIEAADAVGGRVRTDEMDGFLLDRGFQVLLTAYPEARRVLDYDALDLRPFYPGALIRKDEAFARLADPTRRPGHALQTLFSGVGSFGDKLRILKLRKRSREGSLDALMARDDTTTHEALDKLGFSEPMIEGFFRPWLGGAFLDPTLETSSRMLEFVIRMFGEGDTALPAKGMGAIPAQLAAGLEPGTVRLKTKVSSVRPGAVTLEGGETIYAEAVVVATEANAANRLLGGDDEGPSRSVVCIYFAADEDPVGEPILVLDGDNSGPVQNLVVPSAVSPHYAPAGKALISASVLGAPTTPPEDLVGAVRNQLRHWYGEQVDGWRHLRSYRIPEALPVVQPAMRDPRHGQGIFVCGDHRESASIQGAMSSGRRCAEAILADRSAPVSP